MMRPFSRSCWEGGGESAIKLEMTLNMELINTGEGIEYCCNPISSIYINNDFPDIINQLMKIIIIK